MRNKKKTPTHHLAVRRIGWAFFMTSFVITYEVKVSKLPQEKWWKLKLINCKVWRRWSWSCGWSLRFEFISFPLCFPSPITQLCKYCRKCLRFLVHWSRWGTSSNLFKLIVAHSQPIRIQTIKVMSFERLRHSL